MSIELRNRTRILHRVVPRVADRQIGTARAGEYLEREGIGPRRIERRVERHHPPFVGLFGRVALQVRYRIVDYRRVVRRYVAFDIGQTDVGRAVPDAYVERGVDNLAHGARRLALHRLGIELEVARENQRVHHLLVVRNAFRTAFFADFAAFFLGRKHLLLSDDRRGGCAQQQTAQDYHCFFHGT